MAIAPGRWRRWTVTVLASVFVIVLFALCTLFLWHVASLPFWNPLRWMVADTLLDAIPDEIRTGSAV